MGQARWYVCETKWRAEHDARDRLRRQGFHTMLPTFLKRREVRRAFIDVEVPLFLRYLFVKFDLAGSWRAVASTRGVLRLLGYGVASDGGERMPTPLPLKVADRMLLEYGPGPVEQEPPLSVIARLLETEGDARVTSGPLEGMVGRVVDASNARVSLLLHLLGRPTCVSVQQELVAAA